MFFSEEFSPYLYPYRRTFPASSIKLRLIAFALRLFSCTRRISIRGNWAFIQPHGDVRGNLAFMPTLRDRSRVVPRSDRACVWSVGVEKMQALRNRIESLRNYVAYPLLGMQRVKQSLP